MADSAPRFSSRFTFLISALGIAIGTGNIWRFPRIVATNGGENGAGSFLVAWIMFLLNMFWADNLVKVRWALSPILWENHLLFWAGLSVSSPPPLPFITPWWLGGIFIISAV